MRLTLLKAKEALRHRAPENVLEYRINRCCERLMLNGKFAGSIHTLRLPIIYGQMTAPQNYRTVEGFRLNNHIYDLADQFYQFLPGHSDLVCGCGIDALRDMGDGHAVIYTLPPLGTLLTNYDGSDAQTLTIYGTDSDGMPVTLVIPNKSAAVSNPFSYIDRIHKEQGPVSVRLSHIATDLTTTLLALMAPKTEETYYRRYMLDSLSTTASDTADVLAKLRHIEFTDEEDVLPFTNISALESMMDSLQFRKENDVNLADRYEMDAVNVLNQELGDTRANSTIPGIRMIYPGGTTPRLTSHY